jgi:thioredoxin 1
MKKVNDLQELEKLIAEEKGLALYFYNDNCAPCHSLRPKIIELINESFPLLELYFVDAEAHPQIPVAFGVFTNPTLLVFFEGKEYIRKSKYVSVMELKEKIERIYTMLFQE